MRPSRLYVLALALAVLVVLALSLALGADSARRSEPPRAIKEAVCLVFGPYCGEALRVVRCETGGTFSVYARNGQYLGLFQMGLYARARFGHSRTALGQSLAAFRYFVASGRDWSPWECKP